MKALVISDSHGALANTARLASLFPEGIRPDILIHCGDGIQDVAPVAAAFSKVWQVRGNCDILCFGGTPLERLEHIGGLKLLIVHGHTHAVKRGPETLALHAKDADAQIVCFGHTHRPMVNRVFGVLMINPGALQDKKYALLHFGEEGFVRPELLSL